MKITDRYSNAAGLQPLARSVLRLPALSAVFLALLACGERDPGLDLSHSRAMNYYVGDEYHRPVADGAYTLFSGATLIDGKGSDPVGPSDVLVRGSEIIAVGPNLEAPSGATIVDTQGKWITPGLIDAHVHFGLSGRPYARPAFIDLTHLVSYDDEVEWTKERLPYTLERMLCAGVTGAVSVAGLSIDYRARHISANTANVPSIFVGQGVITSVPEFAARKMFPPFDGGEFHIRPAMFTSDAMEYVLEAEESNADMIKTAYDYAGGWHFRLIQSNAMNWHKTVVQEAGARGMRVTSHTHQVEAGQLLMDVGADSLQHAPADRPVDARYIETALTNEVVIVPTLALRKRTFQEFVRQEYDWLVIEQQCGDPEVMRSLSEVDDMPAVNDVRIKGVVAQTPMANRNVRALYDAGVQLAVGTDAGLMGLMLGSSMHLELAAMEALDIPALDLITMATLNSARVAGKEDAYGSIEPGKFADFLVLNADPTVRIANLQAIDTVVRRGVAYSHQDLVDP